MTMRAIHPLHSSSLALAAMILAGNFLGCGGGLPYEAATVEGQITIDGAAVPKGYITFTPVAGTKGPVVGAAIDNGKFRCERVPLGTHTVTFQAHAAEMDTITERASGATHQVPRDILPPRYLSGETLEIREREFKHHFDLRSRP